MTIMLNPEQRWECPNCSLTDVTFDGGISVRFHNCRGLKGMTAPMVLAGTECKVEAKEREDYIGKEDITYDGEGRPIMSVETTREEGTDLVVFAPCAHSDMKAEL